VAEHQPAGQSRQPVRIVKDMTITHPEFFRTLQRLLHDSPHERAHDGVTFQLGGGRVEIRLGPEQDRRLGRFRLPRTLVEMRFDDCERGAVDAFVARFDLHFRRGGG
jgi:hypothetical protein